jgi:hypothetical protein
MIQAALSITQRKPILVVRKPSITQGLPTISKSSFFYI